MTDALPAGIRTGTARGADGTSLRTWRTGSRGPVVAVSNGLGASPLAWPALYADDPPVQAVGWWHRGCGGSARPVDPERVTVDDHVDDLLAVLDAEGVDRAVVVAWSLGVNVAFEAALRAPGRVAGVLAVAGVPGGTFATMGAPLRVPRPLRRPLAVGTVRGLQAAGPALTAVSRRLPASPRTARVLGRVGVTQARPDLLLPALEEYLDSDWRWYFTLARAAADHHVMDLRDLNVPVTFLVGRSDVMTSWKSVVRAAHGIPTSRVLAVAGTHFLPLEHPAVVRAELLALLDRAG